MDIGLKSAQPIGLATLATGVIMLHFHCLGTTDIRMEMLYSSVRGAARAGAEIRKNHDGIRSSPGDVGLSLSRILKTCSSVPKLIRVKLVGFTHSRHNVLRIGRYPRIMNIELFSCKAVRPVHFIGPFTCDSSHSSPKFFGVSYWILF